MEAVEFAEVSKAQRESGNRYLQFINQGSLSLGLYVLPAGSIDAQTPHAEDEVYFVVSGVGSVQVGGETRLVQQGSIIFVARDIDHRFFDIREDLSLLVFFAPQHAG